MKYQEREPDFETEQIRGWTVDKDSEDANKINEIEEYIEVELEDGMKIRLVGYEEVRKNNELLFAWKVKSIENLILWYSPNPNAAFNIKAKTAMQKVAKMRGKQFQEVTPKYLKNIIKEATKHAN